MRTGCVFRSGHLAEATDRDLVVLQQLGIDTVIDLRNPGDFVVHGEDRLPPGATLVRIPDDAEDSVVSIHALFDSGTPDEIAQAFPLGSARELMLASAVEWSCNKGHFGRLAEVIRWIIKSPGATLFHCSAGKDRTGFTGAVIQWAAGVDDEVIVVDYLRSNDQRQETNAALLRTLQDRGVPRELLEPLIVQRGEYISRFLESARQHWGDVDGYLRMGLGLTDHEITSLRARLLD